jgi:ubiquinone/menaquinone biosynthesis C-methylase UbiE
VSDYWDDKADLLRASRALFHNEDYWRFLVREVWRIGPGPQRIADFGCGAGWCGLWLLPMLPAGSRYAGLDRSGPLLQRGREAFAATPYTAELVQAVATAAPFPDDSFDIAIAHTVLMHLPDAAAGLAEMIRVTRPGGLVIACDASQTAINALIHVHETHEQEHAPLSLFQAMHAYRRRTTGVDRNLGMKTPVLMRQAGLVGVAARISDAVRTSFPPLDTPEKRAQFDAICDGGLGVVPEDEAAFARTVADLVSLGMSEADAAAELRREIANDYRHRGAGYHIVQPGLLTISYGWKPAA